ncbi:hypothetical protein ATE49_14120 [Elizabethkingia miricola]|nr:hypothetical protein ATE49_14120 [Elizabethkingia miricola]
MMSTEKKKADKNNLQRCSPETIGNTQIGAKKKEIAKTVSDSSSNIDKTHPKIKRPKRCLWEYVPPTLEVAWIEMENGIAAGSGFALPASTNTLVNETWDNKNITPDKPTYW